MATLTRWVLAHRRLVVAFWIVVTVVGIASAGSASSALKQKFSVPGKEGWQTNQQIARDFRGTGGNSAPLVPVVTLPAGKTVSSPGVRATTVVGSGSWSTITCRWRLHIDGAGDSLRLAG